MILGNNNTITMTYNALTATNKAIEKTARALSTGQKAASASDDAAGVAIGMKISAQVAGVDRAIRNTQDGISLLQTAEGGLEQINSMLQRMRELAVQAANDTLTIQDRGYIQNEIAQLRESINNVANNTTFNSKRLLDGSSAAEWTSDNASTKLKVSGALTEIDQFGQKKQIEGNYRIEIHAKAGQGQVQKSNIMTLTVDKLNALSSRGGATEVTDAQLEDILDKTAVKINLNSLTEGDSGEGWNFTNGTLNLTEDLKFSIEGTGGATTNKIAVQSGVTADIYLKNVNINVSGTSEACAFDITGATANVYLRGNNTLVSGEGRAGLEVPDGATLNLTSANGDGKESGTLNTSSTNKGAGIGGGGIPYASNGLAGNITIYGGTINAEGAGGCAGIGGGETTAPDGGGNITISGGNITAKGGEPGGAGIGSGYYASGTVGVINDGGTKITINGGTINATGASLAAGIGGAYSSDSGVIRIRQGMGSSINATAGSGAENIGKGDSGNITDVEYVTMPEPEPRAIPDSDALSTTRLSEARLLDISQFYNASGVFLVTEPQKITITQGDGKSTDVTLYKTDTIEDVRSKLNDAIAFGLGQANYTDNNDKFVTFVNPGANDSQGFESVEGTFVIRSAVAGNAGNLTFASDNQDLINALGLNTLQEASENTFTASVYDAHTGKVIANNVSAQGNMLNGVISTNASIEFDSMANVKAKWNEGTKSYVLNSETEAYITTLHIKDKSTSFQVGQNLGEDIYLNIGDVRAEALGINKVDVTTRENAAKSITLLDAALHEVNVQRSRIGAYQNELEYNANSLTQTSLHMQESESRIKDADMAMEYMEFVKLQILNNTGNSMLSQSQQNAQSIMNVLTQ